MANDHLEAKSKKPGHVITNSIGMKLVWIPAGEFVMGTPSSEKGHHVHEGPQHRVQISKPFYLGVTEVTQEEYERVMGENPSQFREVLGKNTSRFPVDSVTWDEAVEFCGKLSAMPTENKAGRAYRLSTEAEWEYACRAGTNTPFSFGFTLSSAQANFNGFHPYGRAPEGNFLQRPTVVGSYRPNAFGLYDMHGNVYEWCSDRYAKDYYKQSKVADPGGPAEGPYRVVRGGGWQAIAAVCRSGERYYDLGDRPPDSDQAPRRYPDYGFRVLCDD